MPSLLVAARRRLPKRLRSVALRAIGRTPAVSPDQWPELWLTLPVTPPRALVIREPGRTYVGRLLARTGLAGYEPDTLACFLAAIDVAGPGAVYDVGANVGVFSWLAAALTTAPVVAFEPTPDLAATMQSICEENDLAVRVEAAALGAEPGTATLYLSTRTDSSNSLREGFRESTRSVDVPVDTVDRFAAATGLTPAVLKVDTESTEPDVLRGAGATLASHRPWIVCEVLAGRTELELTAILGPLGYAWYRIDDAPQLERREAIEGDPTYENLNWLFAPEPPGASFWEALARWRAALATTRRSPSPPP